MARIKFGQGMINSTQTLCELGIIDFGRSDGGLFGSEWGAIQVVSNYVVYGFEYVVRELRMAEYPEQTGFPDWEHAGHHVKLGHQFWNQFKSHFPTGELHFHDSPDFSGKLCLHGFDLNFWGDIGKVSPIAFLETVMGMSPGDLWISVVEDREVILSPSVNAYVIHLYRLREMMDAQPPSLQEFLPTIGYRLDFTLEESVAWLVQRGQWTEAKAQIFLRLSGDNAQPFQLSLFDSSEIANERVVLRR